MVLNLFVQVLKSLKFEFKNPAETLFALSLSVSLQEKKCHLFKQIKTIMFFLKENATVFPYSNMFFPQLRRVDMYLSRLSPCT